MATSGLRRSLFYFLLLSLLLFRQRSFGVRVNEWVDSVIRMPSQKEGGEGVGTRWAVLVAGSSGFGNYRHQADVCHAYQLLLKGGLKEENIVVFMHDDIAYNEFNPKKGIIINHPQGEDVYAGVPKDYTGKQVHTKNLYAVLLGNNSAVTGGSGKVINSKAEDRIFIYYSDHGGPGVLGMPNMPFLYANDLMEVLKKKHKSKGYKEMVIYVEACESGSIFEGLMTEDLNIYVTTASNAQESSWGTYCPGMDPPPPPELMTCLGDLYSVAWMEDSETHNLKEETIQKQYVRVKSRTSNYNTYTAGSHVMEYGDKSIKSERLYLYQGFDPANANLSDNSLPLQPNRMDVVNQRDADLLFLWQRYERSTEGSEEKVAIRNEMTEKMAHREHLDKSVDLIGRLLFGWDKGSNVLGAKRPSGKALVDDWSCLKSMVRAFEEKCGPLTQYGMKHMRAFANICNEGIPLEVMSKACEEVCGRTYKHGILNVASHHGFSG
ncbi:hypothetical protein AMTRI_Chr03g146600 [Amborella trichopoda]